MNYTENYHLPQWVKEDRIMMEDFNQMCSNIDAGMAENRDAAAEHDGELEDRAFDRFCRAAYNHYWLVQGAGSTARQLDMFHVNTAKSSEGLSGMKKFDGYYCLNNGPDFTAGELIGSFETLSTMTGLSSFTPLIIEFTAQCNGRITKIPIHLLHKGTTSGPVFQYQVKFEDLTKETTEVHETITDKLGAAYGSTLYYQRALTLRIGHKYRLTIQSNEGYQFTGELAAGLTAESYGTGGEGSAVHIFQDPNENLGMIAVVTYRSTVEGNRPVLLWNEEEVPVWWDRELSGGVRETAYRSNTPVEKGDTAKLRLTCQPGEELVLRDWGAMLI